MNTTPVVMVVGAGGGIGAGVMDKLGDWTAVGADREGAGAEIELDVTSMESCQSAIDSVLGQHGRLDGLVNCAGIVRRSPAESMSNDDWRGVIDVNLTGAFRLSQAVRVPLAETGGSIVHIASTNGVVAVKGTASYCVSKAGLSHLVRVLALEWADHGIRVNAVAPTMVLSAMTADLAQDDVFMADKMAAIPLGRLATAADVAGSVRFLLSDRAAMVTGQTIMVDGGATIH